MAKYIGPKCRLCRTEGKQLFLKGERCFLRDKCAVLRRQSAPGMHGGKRRNKMTGYGEQLREKQKIKKGFPDAGVHVIANSLFSKDYKSVAAETFRFADSLMK